MQTEIRNKVFLGNTVSSYDDAGRLSAIDKHQIIMMQRKRLKK